MPPRPSLNNPKIYRADHATSDLLAAPVRAAGRGIRRRGSLSAAGPVAGAVILINGTATVRRAGDAAYF